MRSQLSGILAAPLPWWFWSIAAAGGAWAVAEYSGAQKRKQEIATLAGLAAGAMGGLLLQPGGDTAGLGALRGKFRRRFQPPDPIRPATVHRQSWRAR